MTTRRFLRITLAVLLLPCAFGLERPDVTFKIFQFPPNMIPRIDGNTDDWSMVPDSYAIGMDQLMDTEDGHGMNHDLKNKDVKVKVGWVKGLNRLYFLYESYDNYWDFARTDLHNDIFEIVVDGDLSGGPLIDIYHRDVWTPEAVGAERAKIDPRISRSEAHWLFHGVQAQNYHIFTPPGDKDWAMAWGCAQYTKRLPYANAAYNYNFKPGESGKLVLEFWVTPFDYAPCDGPQRAVESKLQEDKLIGLSWAVIDYDDVNSQGRVGFWNLSHKQTFFGNASQLVGFRLMPLEPQFHKPIQANFSYKVADMDRRLVAFKDESDGKVTSWSWDFGDGAKSTEQNPVHEYKAGRDYTVILTVEGPAGTSRKSNVWGVSVR
ncbi:MAG TPA: PKD domain-containing protein [Bryobacteraceae bacterium]|nr:PKD domain-containing protein [Bryobacteraceae bacterium]